MMIDILVTREARMAAVTSAGRAERTAAGVTKIPMWNLIPPIRLIRARTLRMYEGWDPLEEV